MKSLLFFIIIFSASQITPAPGGQASVIWNIGQGQWITIAEGDACLHFDMGGEFFPWQRLAQLCRFRKNKILLSHWDWDHIGALADRRLSRTLPELCILVPPNGKTNRRKKELLSRFDSCKESSEKILQWRPAISRTANEASQVFKYHGILMPGDSTTNEEKIWSQLDWIRHSQVLVLGHHGSKTSTSDLLLKKLLTLRMAISSARWKRYSHPHPKIVARLKHSKIPLLRTEDWGNIWIE